MMTKKCYAIMACGALLFSIGCNQKTMVQTYDLHGLWVYEKAGEGNIPCFILKADNIVVFESVRAQDIALPSNSPSEYLPHNGHWSLDKAQDLITLRLVYQGVTHDHSGKLAFTRSGPVISFVVGDPDLHEMVSFRLKR